MMVKYYQRSIFTVTAKVDKTEVDRKKKIKISLWPFTNNNAAVAIFRYFLAVRCAMILFCLALSRGGYYVLFNSTIEPKSNFQNA